MEKISEHIDPKAIYSYAGREVPGEMVIESLRQNDMDAMPHDWSWHCEYSILCNQHMRAIIVRMGACNGSE